MSEIAHPTADTTCWPCDTSVASPPADVLTAPSSSPLPTLWTRTITHWDIVMISCRPWLGSFGSLENMSGLVDEAPPSPTLFATSQGRVFANLSGARVASADLLLASAQVMASAEPQVVPEDSRGGRLAQAQEAGVLRRKSEARLPPGAPALRGPRGGAARRRMREIGQARKTN